MLSQSIVPIFLFSVLISYRVLNFQKDLAHLIDRAGIELLDFWFRAPALSLQRISATIQDATSHKGPMYVFGYPSAATMVCDHPNAVGSLQNEPEPGSCVNVAISSICHGPQSALAIFQDPSSTRTHVSCISVRCKIAQGSTELDDTRIVNLLLLPVKLVHPEISNADLYPWPACLNRYLAIQCGIACTSSITH